MPSRSGFRHFIFDLDGTLIDSSPSILAGFAVALQSEGIQPQLPLNSNLIGPPLLQTLSILSGSKDAELLERLARSFKAHYDSEGFKSTRIMVDAASALPLLHQAGAQLFIVTNKRLLPTRKILEHLGWEPWFAAIYTLDMSTPSFPNKSAALGALMTEHGLAAADSVYIGDTPEDRHAAKEQNLAFRRADWGYGVWPTRAPDESLTCVAQLEHEIAS